MFACRVFASWLVYLLFRLSWLLMLCIFVWVICCCYLVVLFGCVMWVCCFSVCFDCLRFWFGVVLELWFVVVVLFSLFWTCVCCAWCGLGLFYLLTMIGCMIVVWLNMLGWRYSCYRLIYVLLLFDVLFACLVWVVLDLICVGCSLASVVCLIASFALRR